MPRNRACTHCECGRNFPTSVPIAVPFHQYLRTIGITEQHPYWNNSGYGWHATHIHYHECGYCGRLFALWCNPAKQGPAFDVVDSSFFYAFNDEPSDKDQPDIIAVLKEENASLQTTLRDLRGVLRDINAKSGGALF